MTDQMRLFAGQVEKHCAGKNAQAVAKTKARETPAALSAGTSSPRVAKPPRAEGRTPPHSRVSIRCEDPEMRATLASLNLTPGLLEALAFVEKAPQCCSSELMAALWPDDPEGHGMEAAQTLIDLVTRGFLAWERDPDGRAIYSITRAGMDKLETEREKRG